MATTAIVTSHDVLGGDDVTPSLIASFNPHFYYQA